MTVNVTKPQINLREKISEVDKPSGIAGEAILRSETPQEVFNYINAGRRNLIINGAMQVAQRGTSFTCNNGTFITLDRYTVYEGAAGSTTYTVTQDSDAPAGFSNSLKIVNSTAVSLTSGQYGALGYAVEGYDIVSTAMGTSSAKDVTLSFWVKSSLTGTFGVTFRASGGSTANYVSSYTINSANTWEYKTVTYTATSLGTWNNTNGIGADVVWDLGTGATYTNTAGYWNTGSNKFALTGGTKINGTAGATLQITGVQLEVGKVATPFEHRSYGEELALCQRYYEAVPIAHDQYWTFATPISTTALRGAFAFSEKRASPSVSFEDTTTFINPRGANATISATTASARLVRFNFTSTSLTVGETQVVLNNTGNTNYIYIDSEL